MGTYPSHAMTVPSVGSHHHYAIQSCVNPVLSDVPFMLSLLPSQNKAILLETDMEL